MRVQGTYQGMEILEGDIDFRVGMEPSKGWVTVLLSEMGGKLPTQVDAESMREQWNRKNRANPQIKASWRGSGDVDTFTTTFGATPPKGGNKLAGIWGDLVLQTFSGAAAGAQTEVKLENWFWLEAVIQHQHIKDGNQFNPTGDAVVRIELADERVLWDLGGSVQGRRNWVINDIEDSVAGKILEWDAVIENPQKVKELAAAVTEKDSSRPVLDPRTIWKFKVPYSVAMLVQECCENLPGPPKVAFPDSKKLLKLTPLSIDWKKATLAKTALDDMLTRYNLVLAPDYNKGFQIYERGESARAAGGGVLNAFSLEAELMGEEAIPNGTASLQLKPMAVEIIGERIIEEIACPHWVMVVKDDGIQTGHDQSGFARKVGRWVKAEEYLKDIGYSMEAASISLMANYDMHNSKVYDDIPEENKEKKEKIKATLRKHLFKSFMVAPSESTGGATVTSDTGVNGFRNFLPMILKRVGSVSHALNMPNMAIGREFTVFCDGWTPEKIRTVGQGPFYGNVPMEQVDADDIAQVDHKMGVITFREPRGSLAYLDKYNFSGSSGLVETILRETYDLFKNQASQLAGKLQQEFDTYLYRLPNRDYFDSTAAIRRAMNEFLRETAKADIPDAETMEISKKNLDATVARVIQNHKESLPLIGIGTPGGQQQFNLSEFKLIEPRILAIWGWERNFGRSDDYYRYITGVDTACPAFPLEVKGLVQYIDITGATNKPVLDVLAKISAEEFLEKRDKAIEGGMLRWAGFYPIALSGVVPEVSWRFSRETPEAETITHVNTYQHGIKGRPAALTTWTVYQKPLPKVGR